MILYHGSTDLVDKPKIRVGEVFLDFGVGFYTTTSYEQAERWARIKMRRNNSDIGYVAIYEFDLKKAQKELNQWTLHTDKSLEYLAFIEAKEVR